MDNPDDYIIIGYEAYYVLTNGQSATEFFKASDLQEAATHIQKEIGPENRATVRMIHRVKDEYILLPVASIVQCLIRPRYKEVGDGRGGKRRVKKSEEDTPT